MTSSRAFRLLGLLVASAHIAGAQGITHLVAPGTHSNGPTTSAAIAARIAKTAREYRAYAPVPRVGFFDVAFPADGAEYRRMAGSGLVLITVLTQTENELPIARLYVRLNGVERDLEQLTSVRSLETSTDANAAIVFGNFRVDALYVLPLNESIYGGDFVIDFARNRQGFRLGVMPQSVPTHLRGLDVPRGARRPESSALLEMVHREYPAFVRSP
jgi:hypothetical protein